MESYGSGSIKKIFGRQREPYGFLTIHSPEELKGEEAVFYVKDVIGVSEDEKRLLQAGMMIKFSFTKKPNDKMKAPCPFKAFQVRPQDPMKYNGTVGKSQNGSLVVFLDLLFLQVNIQQMNHTVDAGDKCSVSISWKEMVRALKENRAPIGTLVAVEQKFNSFFSKSIEKQPCRKCKTDNWYLSLGDLSFSEQRLHPFSSRGSSIWSDASSVSNQSSDEELDYDWCLQTIRMAEKVLESSDIQKKQKNKLV